RFPQAEQRGRVEPGERASEALAGCRRDRAHVVKLALSAIGEVGAGMAGAAAELGKEQFSGLRLRRELSIRIAKRASVHVLERGHVRCERVELHAVAGFAVAERLIARARGEQRIVEKSRAAEG